MGLEKEKDDNDFNPSGVSGHDSGSIFVELQNSDDIKAWDSASYHLFSVLRLSTTGAARSVLLKFEQKMADQVTVGMACFEKQVS